MAAEAATAREEGNRIKLDFGCLTKCFWKSMKERFESRIQVAQKMGSLGFFCFAVIISFYRTRRESNPISLTRNEVRISRLEPLSGSCRALVAPTPLLLRRRTLQFRKGSMKHYILWTITILLGIFIYLTPIPDYYCIICFVAVFVTSLLLELIWDYFEDWK